MKILLVSMPSLHFFRWTEQLENSGHEIYWFDIVDGNPTKRLPWVTKINGWKIRYPNLKGRYFVKKRLPFFYKLLRLIIEENPTKAFEKYLNEIKPDVVHSFVLQISCLPILNVMEKHPEIKWMYSSWGSDLYNKKGKPNYESNLKKVLSSIDYLFTDCQRDYSIALKYGFKGEFLGTFPGGGGYSFSQLDKYIVKPPTERRTILIKGYQGKLGRSIAVLRAIKLLENVLKNYKVIVFSADKEVVNYIEKNKLSNILNISIFKKEKFMPHTEIMKLMGEALIYVGNSTSDGMPNTLLEAIIMGAFPIQSNPGGASAEVITSNENGFLIEDCENTEEIKNLLLKAISNSKLINRAFIINQMEFKPKFEIDKIRKKVLMAYKSIT